MLKHHRVIQLLALAILVISVPTACRAPSDPDPLADGRSDRPGTESSTTPDSVSSPTTPAEANSADSDSATRDPVDPANSAASPEETGIADLEKIVDTIAPQNSSDQSHQTGDGPAETGLEDEVALAIATDGLQIITVQTGSIRTIPFETEGDRTIQIVTKVLGNPTETVDANECPAGPMTVTTWPNGLAINTTDQKFMGWNVRPMSANPELTTVAGVGIGTTVKDLKAVYGVEIFESSLGTEFNVGSLSGILSADQPDGTITHLWAGVNCIFR